MLKEFKAFVMRGNVLDLAIGVVIGASFGKIVSSAVEDVIMPVLGLVLGKVNVKTLYIALNGQVYSTMADAEKAKAPLLAYGKFLQSTIDFLIVAFVIFIALRQIQRFTVKATAPAPAPAAPTNKECPFCLSSVPLKATRCSHCTSQL